MVLKAKRNYKQLVADKERMMVEGFKSDMEMKKEDSKWEEQKKEFGQFLLEASQKTKPFQFLVDMKNSLDKGTLTDNMVNAVRKCMIREQEWKKKDEEREQRDNSQPNEGKTITLKVRQFLMKEMQLDSRIITGTVKAETGKAWLIEGHADMLVNASWCVRCGRELHEPASQITGMGEICAEKAGVPYDSSDVLNASQKERTKIKKRFKEKLNQQKFERWIAKSAAEIIEPEEIKKKSKKKVAVK